MTNLLTNSGTAEDEAKWLVQAPAFSVTKVQATLAATVVALLAAVPSSLRAERSVVIACLAAATLILLGTLALVAVDIRTRQRAQEAEARYGDVAPAPRVDLIAVPAERLRIMRAASDDEYEVDVIKVTGDSVRIIATRGGKTIAVPFNPPPSQT